MDTHTTAAYTTLIIEINYSSNPIEVTCHPSLILIHKLEDKNRLVFLPCSLTTLWHLLLPNPEPDTLLLIEPLTLLIFSVHVYFLEGGIT